VKTECLQSLLDEIWKKVNSFSPHFKGIYAYLRPEEFQNMRQQLSEAIDEFYMMWADHFALCHSCDSDKL